MRILGLAIFAAGLLVFAPKSFATVSMEPTAPIRFLDYNYWRLMNPGESCQFTPECDQHENCMQDNVCSPAQCDDTHKCVIGETCDSGFCHV